MPALGAYTRSQYRSQLGLVRATENKGGFQRDQHMSAIAGRPANICSWRAFPGMTDAVEKVREAMPKRNNRIEPNNVLNLYCEYGSSLESMLRGKTHKILFRQHRPKADEVADRPADAVTAPQTFSTDVGTPAGSSVVQHFARSEPD
jgi:hypothetical protein